MEYLGNIESGTTIHFQWPTVNRQGGSVAPTTTGMIVVYKDGNTAQQVFGVTDTRAFDSMTGVHECTIVTTNGWYETGKEYDVVLVGAVVDGQTINAPLAHFAIQNRYAASIYSLPTSVSVDADGELTDVDLIAYQHAAFEFTLTIVDSADTAVDLDGKSLSFIVFRPEDETRVFTLTTGDGDLTIGGDDDNEVTVSSDDDNTATAGSYRWILRNTTDDTLVGKGRFIIEEAPDVPS